MALGPASPGCRRSLAGGPFSQPRSGLSLFIEFPVFDALQVRIWLTRVERSQGLARGAIETSQSWVGSSTMPRCAGREWAAIVPEGPSYPTQRGLAG
jgi:hypothetical protein